MWDFGRIPNTCGRGWGCQVMGVFLNVWWVGSVVSVVRESKDSQDGCLLEL